MTKAQLFGADVDLRNDNDPRSLAVRLVGEGKRVLELGTPTDRVVRALAKKKCHVVAIEQKRSTCAALRKYCTNVIHGDIQSLHIGQHLRGRKLDVVLIGSLLQYVPDPGALLRKLVPFVTEKGFVVATIANVAHASMRLSLLNGSFEYNDDQGAFNYDNLRFFTLDQIISTFAEAKLGIDSVERVRLDPFKVPQSDGCSWDADSIPDAIKHMIERDPEAEVAQYVVKASRISKEAARQIWTCLEAEQEKGHTRALISPDERRQLDRTRLEAIESRILAESRLAKVQAQALRLEREAVKHADQVDRLTTDHALQLDRLTTDHAHQLDRLTTDHALQLDRLTDTHAQQLERLTTDSAIELERVTTKSAEQLAQRDQLIDEQNERISELERRLQTDTAELEQLLTSTQNKARLAEESWAQSKATRLVIINKLQRHIDTVQRQFLDSQNEARDAQQRLEAREIDMQQRNSELQQSLEDSQNETLQAQQTLAAREVEFLEQIADLQQRLEISQTEARHAQQNLAEREIDLMQRISELKQNLEDSQNETLQIEEGWAERISDLQQRLETSQNDAQRAMEQWSGREVELRGELDQRDLLIADKDSQLSRLQRDLETAKKSETRVSELTLILLDREESINDLQNRNAALQQQLAEHTEQITGMQQQLDQASDQMERAQGGLLKQVTDLSDQLRSAARELGERDGRVAILEQQLDQMARTAHNVRDGLEDHATRLEQELTGIRSTLTWKVLGRYDRAKELLLPQGSKRRAAYDKVMAYARGPAEPVLEAPKAPTPEPPPWHERRKPVLTMGNTTILSAPVDRTKADTVEPAQA